MDETVNQIYNRYTNARNQPDDSKYENILQEFAMYTETEKVSHMNSIMKKEDVELFECLLRHHTDLIHLEDEKGSSILHHAAMNNYLGFVYILGREKDICLDEYNCYEQTPLILACTYGHKEVVKMLLRLGSNVELSNAINIAGLGEQEEIFELLIKEQDERQVMTMFRKIRNDMDLFKKAKFLQDFDECGEGSDKKLSFMNDLMKKNEMDIFQMVLDMRKDMLSARDEDGWTLLHNAVTNNSYNAVNILLKREGIEKDALDYFSTTPLMMACRSYQQLKVVELLLENECDVLLKDASGFNALDIAKRSKQKDTTRLIEEHLVKKGLSDNGKLAGQYL